MLAMTLGSRSEVTESVIFHPIDNIYTSIIVDHHYSLSFKPHSAILYNVNGKSLMSYLISQMPLFQYKDPRYMTLDDINMSITDLKFPT